MTLRKKTILVVSLTLLFMGILLYAVAHFVLSKSYVALETNDIIKTTEQLSNQLEEDLSKLKIVVGDWAPWDDTYQFIRDLNSEYIENNLMDSTLNNLDVHLMVFIDTKWAVKYWKIIGEETNSDKEWNAAIQGFIDRNRSLKTDPSKNITIMGYALLQDKIVQLASAPVLTSKFEGPSTGFLLVGRYLDASAVQLLEEKLKYPVEISKILSGNLPENFQDTAHHTLGHKKFIIQRLDAQNIASSILVQDLSGNPIFTARITKPRSIVQQGRKNLNFLLAALSGICFIFMIVTLVFLEKTVLYRLFQLSEDVKNTTFEGDMEGRLSVTGNDEIASLSNCINEMLDKLWENKKNYEILFESASDAIMLLKDGVIVDCNVTALSLFGYPKKQMIGKDPCCFSPDNQPDGESSHQKCQRIIGAGTDDSKTLFEWVYLKKDGAVFETEVNLTSVDLPSGKHLQAIIRDISERKRSQRTMIQAEKMLSLGGLAAGMAHEINNPLAGMMQNAQVIKNRLSTSLPANMDIAEELGISMSRIQVYMEKRKIFRLIESINESGEKAAKIVKNMLSFARKNDSEKSYENIVEVLDNTIELAQTDYNLKSKYDFRQIEILKQYESSLMNVFCHKSNLQQVFFNIFKNAGAAFFNSEEKNKVPKLFLRVFKDKTHVQVEIEDNGPGIDESIRKRVFEPFFTTKEPGEGTGLGLSVSYFIIKEDHNGEISVESEPGQGTKFIIRLPLILE